MSILLALEQIKSLKIKIKTTKYCFHFYFNGIADENIIIQSKKNTHKLKCFANISMI